MIASMTGYGRSAFANEKIKINVDIKSINSKQLDLVMRLPAIFRDQENLLRNCVSPIVERGKIEVTVTYESSVEKMPVTVNKSVIGQYKEMLDNLVEELQLPKPGEYLSLLLRLPEVMTTHSPEADQDEKEILLQAVTSAAENLMESRIKEGKGLYEFFFAKIERIREYLSLTEKYEKDRVARIREKIEQQLARLQGIEIDRGRLEQEMIFYVEKLDVTEEKQRLSSHLNYFEETMGEPDELNVGGKGKKLGFISQEIGREINTLGSKSNDAEMQKLVVMMKDELEQIKEQVLNVL